MCKSLYFQSAFKMYELKFLRRFHNIPQCRYCLLKIIARRTLKKKYTKANLLDVTENPDLPHEAFRQLTRTIPLLIDSSL